MSDKMRIINESSVPFRRDNKSGPKYIARGPNLDFGVVRILPGEDFSTHYHEEVEEIFYTLEGTCDIYVDAEKYSSDHGISFRCRQRETITCAIREASPGPACL